jgi:hypothetical protein
MSYKKYFWIIAVFFLFTVASVTYADTWYEDSATSSIYSAHTTYGVAIGTTNAMGYNLNAIGTADRDNFVFQGYTNLTGEKDIFIIYDNDAQGYGQDESSVFKILKYRPFSDEADGASLAELTYQGTPPTVADRQFYILGRGGATANEGQVSWGISANDSDFWTIGSINGGATGTDCGGTGTACFNSPSFHIAASGDSYINGGNMGIGTSSPTAGLHLADNDGALFTGTFGSGSIPVEGAGTRMMWYPGKAAFRAGYTTDQWNDSNIGIYSVAMGGWTQASGERAVALGSGSDASGEHAISIGSNPDASGQYAVAIGRLAEATGALAVAIGPSEATNTSSVAIGDANISSGSNSFALGNNSDATNYSSFALGSSAEASGSVAFSMGSHTEASGDNSTAIGYNTTAQANNSFVLGRYNETSTSYSGSSWVTTDPLFVIGNGSSASRSNNALIVYKNGNMQLDGSFTATGTICDSTGCIGGGSSGTSTWGVSGSDIYYNSGHVGIGTTAPDSNYQLHVINDGANQAIRAESTNNIAINAYSDTSNAVYATTLSSSEGAIEALSYSSSGPALEAINTSGGDAAWLTGDVMLDGTINVTGDITADGEICIGSGC